MKLLGDWNWYLPKWLEWLPHLEHDGSVDSEKAKVKAPHATARTASARIARALPGHELGRGGSAGVFRR
jgi:hypothetical protein